MALAWPHLWNTVMHSQQNADFLQKKWSQKFIFMWLDLSKLGQKNYYQCQFSMLKTVYRLWEQIASLISIDNLNFEIVCFLKLGLILIK